MGETILQLPITQRNNGPTDIFYGISGQYGTILIDPPWRFMNRTGKWA